MKQMFIDGLSCEFENAPNVLEVALNNNIDIPHMCYCENLSAFGGCRLCLVETEKGAIESACTLIPEDGMSIRTNSAKLRKHRQMTLELMLASHRAECTTCEKSGKCRLQQYSKRYGVRMVRFAGSSRKAEIEDSSPALIRDPSKCVLCGSCVRMCSELQGIHAIDFAGHGSQTFISCGLGKKLTDTDCVSCGQCAAVCPTSALVIKNDVQEMWKVIYSASKSVAIQIDPAVSAAVAEEFGLPAGQYVAGKLCTALRMLGVDYVFDTAYAFDMRTKKAARELSDRLAKNERLPLVLSGCHSVSELMAKRYPGLLSHCVSGDSAMMLLAQQIRDEYADEELFSVAAVPCASRKAEAVTADKTEEGEKLIDLTLTTQELVSMIKEAGISLAQLPDARFDSPFVSGSDTGILSAVPGGMTEAVLKQLGADFDGSKAAPCGVSDFEVQCGDKTLSVAVVCGLADAQRLLKDIEAGKSGYDLIEINTCPYGCVGGSGQPALMKVLAQRKNAVYSAK